MTKTWRDLLGEITHLLPASASPTESRFLLQHVASMTWPALVLALDEPADPEAIATARLLCQARRAGSPVQHVVGRWGFRGLDVKVDGRALVPRPETELVAGIAIEALDSLCVRGRPGLVVDLGTGSGVIALSIALERPGTEVIGVDCSADALDLARENLDSCSAIEAGLSARVRFLCGDFYEALPPSIWGSVDLVVSNPPYVAAGEWAGLEVEVRDHDPYEALVAGPSGLEAVRAVVAGAPAILARPGALVVEIAPGQKAAALDIATAAGMAGALVRDDLAGRPRALLAVLPAPASPRVRGAAGRVARGG